MLLFLSYSFGIETTYTFMHSLENHTRIQTRVGKVYTSFQTKTAQKPYPLGWHIPKRQIKKSTLPSPAQGYRMKHSSLCYPKFSITYRFVTFCAIPQVSSRLGVGLQNKNNKISLNEKELFPSYETVDKK